MAAASGGNKRRQQSIPIPAGLEDLEAIEADLAKMENQLIGSLSWDELVKLRGGQTGYQPNRYVEGNLSDSEEYDPAAIYTRSTNAHDHSVIVHVGLPREVRIAVQRLVGLRIWPEYRSEGDFIRNAIMHQLHRDVAAAGLDSYQPMLAQERFWAWVEERDRALNSYKETGTRFQKSMENSASLGSWEHVIDTCDMAEAAAASMPEPFKGQMLDVVGYWRKETAAKSGGGGAR